MLAQPGICDMGVFGSPTHLPHQIGQGHSGPLQQNDDYSAKSASQSPSSISTSKQEASPVTCCGRASLMLLTPKVATVVREKQTDKIFEVTGEVLKACQGVMDCTTCQLSCTDFLVMMAVLQETRTCFDLVAKSDLGSAIKLSFGRYEVTSTDAKLRAMLVMDLVQKANTVLSSISSKCKSMIATVKEPCALARANIAYLEASMDDFRNVLHCVTGYATVWLAEGATVSDVLREHSSLLSAK